MHREAPNPARGRSEAPGVRLLAIETRAGDVGPVLRIERHSCELGCAKTCDAVIVAAQFVAIEIEAMDHAGVEIRHEQLLVRGIVGEIAQARARIRHAVERHIGEQRHRAGAAIDLVDGAGTALQVEPKLSLHPADAGTAFFPALGRAVAAATDNVEAEHRSGGDIDIGRSLIVERDTENLADVFGKYIEDLRGGQQPAVPDISRLANIDDTSRRSVRVDESQIDRGFVRRERLRRIRRQRSGKSGDGRVAQIQAGRTIGLLRSGIAGIKKMKNDKQQQRQKPCDDPGHALLPIAGP